MTILGDTARERGNASSSLLNIPVCFLTLSAEWAPSLPGGQRRPSRGCGASRSTALYRYTPLGSRGPRPPPPQCCTASSRCTTAGSRARFTLLGGRRLFWTRFTFHKSLQREPNAKLNLKVGEKNLSYPKDPLPINPAPETGWEEGGR